MLSLSPLKKIDVEKKHPLKAVIDRSVSPTATCAKQPLLELTLLWQELAKMETTVKNLVYEI